MRKVFLGFVMSLCLALPAAAQTDEAPQAGDTREDDFGIAQQYVPAGCFVMGTSPEQAAYARTLTAPGWTLSRLPSEQPEHEVCLTQAYWIDTYEVTRAAFQAFVEAGGYEDEAYWSEAGLAWLEGQTVEELAERCPDETDPDAPQVCITWYEAEAYAAWRGGHLPTEAQWEFAARGEDSSIYPWGDTWDTSLANVENSEGLMPVGSFPGGVSWVGAHDMAGNAMEWVADWLSPNYRALMEQRDDPTGQPTGSIKIEKGGWWGSNAVVSRSAYRHFEDPPTYVDHHIGFRIVTAISEDEG